MKRRNIVIPIVFFSSIVMPTIISAFATAYTSIVLLIITLISMFLILRIPIFKHRENLWMFVISTFTMLPINIFLIRAIEKSYLFEDETLLYKALGGFVIYAILFAVEQITLGIITRFLYRRQYKLALIAEDRRNNK